MSSIDGSDDPGRAFEDAARVKFSSNLDQVHHILLLHKLANAYLTASARMLFAKFLDRSEEEINDESRAA
jgi:hypothetical protein